jgi:integrase
VTRRAPGEGTVYQRGDGRWCAQISVKNDLGITRRRTVYGRTQREVLVKRKQALQQASHGVTTTSRTPTIRDFGTQWLDGSLAYRCRAGHLAESTLTSYRTIWERHISPPLGHLRLDEITPAVLRSWMSRKVAETNTRNRPHSPRTLQYMHAVLRTAMNEAVRDGLIVSNPLDRVQPPRGVTSKVQPLSVDEARLLLKQAATCPHYALWVTLLATGLRIGEALALRWSDLDLDRRVLTVAASVGRVGGQIDAATGRRTRTRLIRMPTKTVASKAEVAIPEFAVEVLRQHRARQSQQRLAGRSWADLDLVFATSTGTYLDKRNILRRFKALAAAAGITRNVRVHDLRHSTASHMLAEGVSLLAIQATLRHTRHDTTANVYAHQLEEVGHSAAQAMDNRLRSLTEQVGSS